jgi:hypothetical protein
MLVELEFQMQQLFVAALPREGVLCEGMATSL